MQTSSRLPTAVRAAHRLINVLLPLAFLLLALYQPAAQAEPDTPRHLGYGISVGPHLPPRPDLLEQMGMDWVKIYDTPQFASYPNQRILYRIDTNPLDMAGWEAGLDELARQLAAQGVDAVEIGNEPNLSYGWSGQRPDARAFTDALCRAYRIFKQVAPEIVVVSGGLAPTITTPDRMAITDLDFAQQMLNAGAGACFDAFGYHPYGFNQPPEADPNRHALTFRRTERVYQLLWDNGIRDRQIWITEFGWVRDPREDGIDCSNDPNFAQFAWMTVSRQVQAGYTARAFRFAEQNWPWAGPMFLWNLDWNTYQDQNYEPLCSHMRYYSVLDRNGNPLPVFYAVQQLQKRPSDYRPTVGAVVHSMTQVVEAGCAGDIALGNFTVLNTGYPGPLNVTIEPVNGPGRPLVWTDVQEAVSGTPVTVFTRASGVEPGLHLIAVNLRAVSGERTSSYAVRGWLLVHYPARPECVQGYNSATPERP
jgi:hypothetical protein